MDIKNVIMQPDGKSLVEVMPTNEDGIFVGYCMDEPMVGESARIYDISEEDARAIAEGNSSVVERYVRPEQNRPGSFTLVNCFGWLALKGGASASLRNGVLQEFVPFVPEVADRTIRARR